MLKIIIFLLCVLSFIIIGFVAYDTHKVNECFRQMVIDLSLDCSDLKIKYKRLQDKVNKYIRSD